MGHPVCLGVFGHVLDGSGSIGTTELANAMKSLGMNPGQKELENLIREVDQDGNGEIDFQEFCDVMKRMTAKKVSWDDIIKQCFEVFDRVNQQAIYCKSSNIFPRVKY